MAKTKTISIDRFDGGISSEVRNLPNGYFRYIENGDCGERVKGIKQVANTSPTTNTKNITQLITVGDDVYGLGWNDDTNKKVTIWKYSGSTWSSVTPSTNYTWISKQNPTLVYDGTYIYFDNNTKLGRLTVSNSSIDGNWYASGGSTLGIMWQGDITLAIGQAIQRITTSAGAGASITMPTGQTPIELIDMGNLLGIICNGGSSNVSKMYIWDGVSTTTFSDIIEIGRGYVAGGGKIDGVIHTVMNSYDYKKIFIKAYNGSSFQTQYSYDGRENSSTPNKYTITAVSKVKVSNNFIYMLIGGTVPSSTDIIETYIARYGRKEIGDRNTFTIYKNLAFIPTYQGWPLPYADFVIQNANTYTDIPIMASIFDTSDTMKLIMQNTVYTAQPLILETGIYTGGDSSIEKKLFRMSIQCSPLTSGQSVALYYKPDADTSWIEIHILDTVGEISYEPYLQADGNNLRTSKEVAFRIELLGGAELTAFTTNYDEEII